jgi:hypothetical protein
MGDRDSDQDDEELRPVVASTSDAVEQGRGEGADHLLTSHRPSLWGLLPGGWSTVRADGQSIGRGLGNPSVLGFGG